MSNLLKIQNTNEIIIPQNIFQTWHTKLLPPLMFNAVKKIRKNNPRFNYKLFDDNECREFIKQNFRSDVLDAYDRLIPGAYKADLWRYCVLFIHGGIYLDIKYMPNKGFKFIKLCTQEHFVLDADGSGIYNAFIVALPGNRILFRAIRQIVSNVQNKYYGESSLYPTGPKLLPNFISLNNKIVDMKHDLINENNKFIYYNGVPIIRSYNGHKTENIQTSILPHYSILWEKRQIYR